MIAVDDAERQNSKSRCPSNFIKEGRAIHSEYPVRHSILPIQSPVPLEEFWKNILQNWNIKLRALHLSEACVWSCFYLVGFRFQELGLEKGWGDTARSVHQNIHLLLDLIEAPDPCTLENFLGIIPMVFNVVILSPHGYFAQANVLGYPDTGGQVWITPGSRRQTSTIWD